MNKNLGIAVIVIFIAFMAFFTGIGMSYHFSFKLPTVTTTKTITPAAQPTPSNPETATAPVAEESKMDTATRGRRTISIEQSSGAGFTISTVAEKNEMRVGSETRVVYTANNETTIIETGKNTGDGNTRIFSDAKFLGSRYATYSIMGLEGGATAIFDTQDRKKIGQIVGEPFITSHENYLIECGGSDLMNYYIKIRSLPDFTVTADILADITKQKGNGFFVEQCDFNTTTNTLSATLGKNTGEHFSTMASKFNVTYLLDTKKLVIEEITH